jgi:hypothetical protein
MWTALLAFGGGVAAVALKGYVDLSLERRREGRARQVAARLVFEELWTASEGISADLFLGDVPSVEIFSSSAWNEHKALVGAALDFEDWRLVIVGYDAVEDARRLCAVQLEVRDELPLPRGAPLDSDFVGTLDDLRRSIALARQIVAKLIRGYEWDPFPGDEVTDEFAKSLERRRRRARVWRRLRRRIDYLLSRSAE